jgi:ABC-type multidrug transport system ATPase subunit
MSIDNIDTTMRKIKNLIQKNEHIQFIFSFNSPRVLKHFPRVLSMYDGTFIELHSDEDMLSEIRKHKSAFDKARKNSRGRPKIID